MESINYHIFAPAKLMAYSCLASRPAQCRKQPSFLY